MTAISWVLLGDDPSPKPAIAPCFEEPLREALGADYTEALPLGKLTLAAGLFALRVRTAALRGEGGHIRYGPHRANRPTSGAGVT